MYYERHPGNHCGLYRSSYRSDFDHVVQLLRTSRRLPADEVSCLSCCAISRLTLDESEELLPDKLAARLSLSRKDIVSFSVARKGVDARHKGRIKFVYTIEFCRCRPRSVYEKSSPRSRSGVGGRKNRTVTSRSSTPARRIIIAGMGPAGLFAALRLTALRPRSRSSSSGAKPIIERVRDVQTFWDKGHLDPESNVQFGEGGAGTFSDGKLTTRVRDANIGYLLQELVRFGAPSDILYLAKPHIGTDRLRGVVTNISRHLESRGVEIRFRTRLTDIISNGGRLCGVVLDDRDEERCDVLVLAPGHSARDTYRMLVRPCRQGRCKAVCGGGQGGASPGIDQSHTVRHADSPQAASRRLRRGVEQHPHRPLRILLLHVPRGGGGGRFFGRGGGGHQRHERLQPQFPLCQQRPCRQCGDSGFWGRFRAGGHEVSTQAGRSCLRRWRRQLPRAGPESPGISGGEASCSGQCHLPAGGEGGRSFRTPPFVT